MRVPSGLDFSPLGASAPERTQPTLGVAQGEHGVCLVYELHGPARDACDVLVFYHGGGANRRAGYGFLASQLAARGTNLAVCLADMRGHGDSGGPRGDTEDLSDPWKDVDHLVDALRREHPRARIHLGGHSSGAGLLLNYATQHIPRSAITSLILLAPEFGFRARLYRQGTGPTGPFARVRTWPFLLHAVTGGRFGGRISAVRLNYEGCETAQDIGCITRYSVNMALSVTPPEPAGQLARLTIPTWIGIAEADEITDASKFDAFLALHAGPAVKWQTLPGSSHLGIVARAVDPVLAALEHAPPMSLSKTYGPRPQCISN